MDYIVRLNIKNKKCVIIGGGRAAAIKAARLVGAGADLHIIAPDICEECRIEGAKIEQRKHRPDDTDGAFIVFALTDDKKLNKEIEAAAKAKGALIGGSDFSVAASRQGENIAVSVLTGYPKLSAELSERLLSYDEAAGKLKQYRDTILKTVDDAEERDRLLSEAFKNAIN